MIGPDAEAKFRISDMECIFSRGFSNSALRRITEFLKHERAILLEAWNEYQE